MTIAYLDIRVLRRAVEIAGGEAELALRLEVSPHRLTTWLGAHAPLPHAVFLRAVDIVLEHEHASLTRSADQSQTQ